MRHFLTVHEGGSVIIQASKDVTEGELLGLYEDVGWSAYTVDPDRLTAATAGSSHVVAARESGLLIGLAR